MHRKRRIKTSQFNVTEQRFFIPEIFQTGLPRVVHWEIEGGFKLGPV